ncbi:isocitrate/isopropylmalate family dehydrogenase [Flavonifractor plautii]|nr:isocitrate/isopropylmalate family dehydrogenase [Flavonifractor plautii]
MARFQAKIGLRERAGPFILLINIRFLHLSNQAPERFAPGLSLGHTPERKPSITFLKVTLLFWNFSHMISFGIMKLHKTNRIYSYKDWECACHGKENCRFARGWNWSEVVNESIKVLERVAQKFGHTFHYYDIIGGVAGLEAYGDALRPQDYELGRSCDSILFGSVGDPRKYTFTGANGTKNTQAVRRPQ